MSRGRPRGAPVAARTRSAAAALRPACTASAPTASDPGRSTNVHDHESTARRHDHHRHVRRRALGRGRRARGPRLLRDRQPAADAHRQGRRAGPRRASSPQRYALVVDVRSGDVRRRPRRRARRAPGDRAPAPASCSSTRPTTCSCAASRRPGAATRSPTPSASPTASPNERALLEELEGPGRRRRRHVELNVHELRDRLARALRRRRAPTARCRSTSCRSATSTACRSTSTSCSTAASCPNPHWVDELRPLPGTDAAGPRLRAAAGRDRGVPRRARAPVRADAPGLRARGQGVPLDRGRLHRRPPPQRGRSPSELAQRPRRRSASRPHVRHRDVDRG